MSDLAVINQFEAEAVQRFCARIGACCNELSYPFDEAGCERLSGNNIVQFFNFEFFPGSHYDPAAGNRCLDGIETPELVAQPKVTTSRRTASRCSSAACPWEESAV